MINIIYVTKRTGEELKTCDAWLAAHFNYVRQRDELPYVVATSRVASSGLAEHASIFSIGRYLSEDVLLEPQETVFIFHGEEFVSTELNQIAQRYIAAAGFNIDEGHHFCVHTDLGVTSVVFDSCGSMNEVAAGTDVWHNIPGGKPYR